MTPSEIAADTECSIGIASIGAILAVPEIMVYRFHLVLLQ